MCYYCFFCFGCFYCTITAKKDKNSSNSNYIFDTSSNDRSGEEEEKDTSSFPSNKLTVVSSLSSTPSNRRPLDIIITSIDLQSGLTVNIKELGTLRNTFVNIHRVCVSIFVSMNRLLLLSRVTVDDRTELGSRDLGVLLFTYLHTTYLRPSDDAMLVSNCLDTVGLCF